MRVNLILHLIMINLGKSLSVSESKLDKYLLGFLKEEAMIGVYFSLVLCSTTKSNLCWE